MKLKNNSLIAGGFVHPKNSQSVNLRLASNLLKSFQTPNMALAQKVINNNFNLLKTLRCSKLSNAQKVISNNQNANMQVAQKVIRVNLSSLYTSLRGAQILSVTGSYSQKKDSVQAVLIWAQQGIKTNGYEFNYIRLALNYNSLSRVVTNYPNNIGLVRHSNLVNEVHKLQPFGSMPRDCNSFLIMRLIHAARDSSPSCACATSIISRSSGSSLNWNGGFPRLSVLCVDTSITPVVLCLCVITHYTLLIQKATPRSARDTIEASNHNVKRSNIMAIYKSTQTHPKFIQHHSAKFLAQYKPVKNNLPLLVEFSYIDSAPYKTGVRYCSLNIPKATHDAESVFFCVQTKHINAPYSHSMVWCIPLKAVNLLSIGWNTLHRPSMVALMGQPSGWLVFPFGTSTAIPVNVTTPLEYCSSGGDSLNKPKEIIPMMTIPNSAYPKFLWRFFSCQQSKFFTVEAISEQEARSMLPDAPCLFSARIRQRQGVNHA